MGLKYEWIPTVGVGPFRFGVPVEQYVASGLLKFESYPEELGGGGSYVDKGDNLAVSVEDQGQGVVYIIQCDASMLFKGRELIGVSLADALEILGREPDEFGEELELDDDEIQVTAEFDELGLTLWLKDNVTMSASVGDGNLEEDEN